MSKEYKFKIGDWVETKKILYDYKQSETNEGGYITRSFRKFNTTQIKILGQICGMKRLHFGEYKFDVDGQKYLDIDQTKYVYLIREGMINKPIMALEEDIEHMPFEEIVGDEKQIDIVLFKLPFFKK